MKRLFFSFLIAMLSLLQVSAYKQQSINITVNGKQRNMVVYTPNSLPDNSPLFIVTHGMNQDPEYQYGSDKMYEMIDTAKFVVTYLRSDGNTWDIGGSNDQNFVSQTIDEMASRYKINRDRVYWSGFSMGSMLIHHCIANMQEKIAAFAPTSGIQFSEEPWNKCKKPVNLLECIAYGDATFGYEEYHIHDYIENYAKHDKHTKYTKTEHYKPIASSWYDGDLEKWTGGPNGGEVWLYSYNNGGHWPNNINPHLIWNFCKRFSLHPTTPVVKISQPAGETTHLCIAPQGEAEFPDITVTATAPDPNGNIEKIDFYDGKELFDTKTATPCQATLTAPTAGKHEIRVVATDNDGEHGEASCLFNYTTTQRIHYFQQSFKTENVVPTAWQTSNGITKRVGGSDTYSDGPRILHFTNSTRAFEYGLLVQSNMTKAKASWAKFGVKAARSAMTLHPGHYAIKYKICNWNQPNFAPVTLCIEKRNGQEVASQVFTPTVNIGGSVENKFSNMALQTFEFDITEKDDYVIAIYTDTSRNSDFVLGYIGIQPVTFGTTGIEEINNGPLSDCPEGESTGVVYDLSGRRHAQPSRSVQIVRTKDGKTKKVMK